MQALDGCKIQLAVPESVLEANLKRNSERGLPLVTDTGDWREAVPCAIVGAGPSLHQTLPELRKFKHIMAAGSSHDWLVARGVYPTWAIACDPDPIMANYYRNPWPHTKYLISSFCDDAVFRALRDYQVYLWDVMGPKEKNVIFEGRESVAVGGGATVGTRAIVMALFFGFWNIHLFGMDNCVWPDAHHCFGEFEDPREELTEFVDISLEPNGRQFKMAGYMLAQLFDFKTILKHLGNRMRVTVHGDGALAELMRLGKIKAGAILHENSGLDGAGRSC